MPQIWKIINIDQKTTFLELWGGAIGLENLNPQKTNAWPLLNVPTGQTSLSTTIRRKDMREPAFFSRLKRGETTIFPLLIDPGGWSLDMLCNFWSYSSSPPRQMWSNCILIQVYRLNFTSFGRYWAEQIIFNLGGGGSWRWTEIISTVFWGPKNIFFCWYSPLHPL